MTRPKGVLRRGTHFATIRNTNSSCMARRTAGRRTERSKLEWEIRYLIGDDIVSVRTLGEIDVARLEAMAADVCKLAQRQGAVKFMFDYRDAGMAVEVVRTRVVPLLARIVIAAGAQRLASIVCHRSIEPADLADPAPDFGARHQIFGQTAVALYWLAGRRPRSHQVGSRLAA